VLSQPHFEASVKMRLAFPKVGTCSPLGLPQLQSSMVEVKTPCFEVIFILLKRPWSVDVENGLAWAIRTSTTQVMVERRVGRLPTTKSRESTRSWCVQVECDTPLESSWRELQICFKPHPNSRFKPEVMSSQNLRNPN
jgi:hypothetical protein